MNSITNKLPRTSNPAHSCTFGAAAKNGPGTGPSTCTMGLPQDSLSKSQSEDLGLIPNDLTQASQQDSEPSTMSDVAFGAGMGALAGGILPSMIPFIGFVLAPVGIVAGGLIGAAVGASMGE